MKNSDNHLISGLVSIAIPAYKRAYLKDAITSVLTQDYLKFELVIVNDCSPQDIDSVVAKFDDPRIRYYKNEENLGSKSIVLNWNKCLSLAKGEFFVLLCDDDVLLPNFVSELMKLAEKYPSCNVFHARKINMLEDGNQEESPIWPEYETFDGFLKKALNKERHHTVTEFMYRTAHIQKKGGYVNFPIGYYSDRASVMDLCKEGGVASSEDCLVKFRFSGEHITSSPSPVYSLGKAKAALEYWDWVHQYPAAMNYEQQIREDVQSTLYHAIIHLSFIQRMKFLFSIPGNIASLKIKAGFLYSFFRICL